MLVVQKLKQEKLLQFTTRGKLTDGTKFDSSYDRNQPIDFPLGQGRVQGWDEGISLLNVGSKATFIIPPDLAYGARGVIVIPPEMLLLYLKVELVDKIAKKLILINTITK